MCTAVGLYQPNTPVKEWQLFEGFEAANNGVASLLPGQV
jgi:hypothetical protein